MKEGKGTVNILSFTARKKRKGSVLGKGCVNYHRHKIYHTVKYIFGLYSYITFLF